tara:strand:+ start:31 stop:1716 length:1686 start_codon:yes stop_codon:yes gene_type:complete
MVSNYLTFLISYILIILSVVGHGVLAIKLTKTNISTEEIGFVGLVGIFFLILYSYITHFFLSHGYIHNLIFVTIGLVSVYYFRSKILIKKNSIFLFSIFSVIFLAIVIFKTHDDFGYYHFPYSYYLNKFSMIIGTGPINHGFRTPSSIFYLNSLFYLPYLDYYLYHMGALLVLGFTNIILISNIKKNLDEKENNQFFFLNLLAFIFINIFFYRLAEHGTDRSAQILIFLFFIYILPLRGRYENFDSILSKLIILLSIIVSLKSFYVLYIIFIIPFFYYIMKDDKGYLVYKIFKNPMLYFSILMGVCVILVYFFNTGCLLYPVQQTCITGMEWSIPKSEVSALNTHYQWWSKAGGGPGYSHELEKSLYIQNFNWLSNWIDKYFFNKMSDLLLGLSLISIIVLLIFRSKKKYLDHKKSNNNILYYYFIILLLVEWFYNHPALRYGGYIIFALIFFIPLSNFLSNYEISKNFKIKTNILFFLVTLIFLGRNIDRIFYEFEFYNANFKHNMFFFTDKYHFRIDDQLKKYSKNYQNCNLNIDKCLENKDFVIKKNYGKLIIIKNRN